MRYTLICLLLVCALSHATHGQTETALAPSSSADVQSPSYVEPIAESLSEIDKMVAQGPFTPTWEALSAYQVPQWYKDAKFGIFIHWGVYCVPAFGSEWYPRRMYIDTDVCFKHHRGTWGPQDEFGYKDFIPKLTAENFDPTAWAQLFKDCGARYVVPVAEHHDGFPMYDCSFTKWDASEMGPKRDIVGELAKATRAAGLRFGVSSHRAFNWTYYVRRDDFDTVDPALAGLYGRTLPYLFTEEAKKHNSPWPAHDQAFKDDWLARTAELVDNYEPDLIWFDFGICTRNAGSYAENPFSGHLKRFAAYYYNHAAARGEPAIINYKWEAFPEAAAVYDMERSKMDRIREPFWQTDTAVSSSSWGYTENQKYKPVNRIVDDLVDIVAKNGCMLLNVGPRADGTIPDEDQRILREIGDWLELNGDAIYGSHFWKVYGEGPTTTDTGHVSEHKNKTFTSEDIRFTTKDGQLYAIALAWPEDGKLKIKTLRSDGEHAPAKLTSITLVGSDAKLTWQRTDKALVVNLPPEKPCEHAFVFRVN